MDELDAFGQKETAFGQEVAVAVGIINSLGVIRGRSFSGRRVLSGLLGGLLSSCHVIILDTEA